MKVQNGEVHILSTVQAYVHLPCRPSLENNKQHIRIMHCDDSCAPLSAVGGRWLVLK